MLEALKKRIRKRGMLGRFRERNIAAGDMTYGEYIQLCTILRQEQLNDLCITQQIVELLHGRKVSLYRAIGLLPYAKRVNDAIVEWIKREEIECYVAPTQEQQEAGIEKMAKECGELGAIVSLSETYQCSFEDVLKMPYTDVFAINKVNAQRALFERRYNKVMEAKSRKKGK